MKYYILKGVVNGRPIKEKDFSSRALAEKKLDKVLSKYNLQVEEDRFLEKHVEEFVCNYNTRFSIGRVVVEL